MLFWQGSVSRSLGIWPESGASVGGGGTERDKESGGGECLPLPLNTIFFGS